MDFLDIIKQFADLITIADVIWLIGLILLISWLLKMLLGPDPLADSVPRRNNMPLYLPFITLLIWFGAISLIIPITKLAKKLIPDLHDWQTAFLGNTVILIGGIGVSAVVIFLVKAHFPLWLKRVRPEPKNNPQRFLCRRPEPRLHLAHRLSCHPVDRILWRPHIQGQFPLAPAPDTRINYLASAASAKNFAPYNYRRNSPCPRRNAL